MRPLLSLVVALVLLGAAFTSIHWLSLSLGLPDLVALMLFALPVIAYIAYCTQPTRAQMLRAGISIYTGFAATLLACAALIFVIG